VAAEEAGAILAKASRLDGTAGLDGAAVPRLMRKVIGYAVG